MSEEFIRIRGARQHNLRIRHLEIPKRAFVVFTGVSGSGKSSLAFDTIYAEGQRRYVESLSSYARQFLGQMDKPAYDKIEGLSPTIAIQQKKASANPRSTVGTITEIHDHLRVLYARAGVQHCPRCNRVVEPLDAQEVISKIARIDQPVLLLAPLVENRKGEHRELLHDLKSRGFVRLRHNGEMKRIAGLTLNKKRKHRIDLIVDRLEPAQASASRLADSVETALREGAGTVVAVPAEGGSELLRLSQNRACASCDIGLPELSPQSFSFNSPLGMCPSCQGLGRRTEMDPSLAVPDPTLTIRQGAVVPMAKVMERGEGWNFRIFRALEEQYGLDIDVPWADLPMKHRDLVLWGNDGETLLIRYKGDRGQGTFKMTFEGILNSLMRRFTETKSPRMREYYMKFFSETACSDCGGFRLRPESMAVEVAGASIVEVSSLSVSEALGHFRGLNLEGGRARIARELVKEIRGRLGFLESVGLDYLTLDRPGPTLSGGEAQRIRLASQIGSELTGVLYVLDEPSIGLHARDNRRLLKTLEQLRDKGNTVLVVEHDAETMRHADHVVDLGPGAGDGGGRVVFSGPPRDLEQSTGLTGLYLSGAERIAVPETRRASDRRIVVKGARENNLKNIDAAIPLGTITAVTGVSGAGKSSLVVRILHPALQSALHGSKVRPGDHDTIEGIALIDKVIHIDQSPIGRTPRSNPATYTGAFTLIRDIFASLPESKMFGFKPGRFSFNVRGGRCEACEGDGVKKVQMHFLPDVYVQCEVCGGKRYNDATLRVRYKGLNVSEVLALSVKRALSHFEAHPKLSRILDTLKGVGMSYVKLGQPAPTLSGGEAQRIKLSRELAKRETGNTLYILDEPTTGLHFDDIRKLLVVLHELVAAGNTVVVIEHNLDVIKCADWIIDLGPGGGDSGGRIIAQGTPEQLARDKTSVTGKYLKKVLHKRRRKKRS